MYVRVCPVHTYIMICYLTIYQGQNDESMMIPLLFLSLACHNHDRWSLMDYEIIIALNLLAN